MFSAWTKYSDINEPPRAVRLVLLHIQKAIRCILVLDSSSCVEAGVLLLNPEDAVA